MRQKGFTLIEVLVTIAILSAVFGVIATLTGQFGSLSAFYAAKEDYDNVFRATQLLILNEALCTSALLDSNGNIAKFDPNANPTTSLGSIYMIDAVNPATGSKLYSVNQAYTPRITIESITLTEQIKGNGRGQVYLPTPAFSASQNCTQNCTQNYPSYQVNLNVQVTTSKGLPSIAVKPIPLVVVTDPSQGGKIIDCFGTTTNAAMCAVLNSTYDPTTGKCNLPVCGAGMQNPPPCPPILPGYSCGPQIYFLNFSQSNAPVCTCVQSCIGPPGAQGPPGQQGQQGPQGPQGGSPAPYYGYGGY